MVKVNRINTSQIEGGYSDDSDKRPNGEMALYNDDNGGFDLVIHDGVNSTNLNKVLGKGKLYGHGADSADGNGYDTIKLIPDIPAYNNGSNQYIIIDPTGPNHVHLRAGGTIDNSNSELILGGENSYVKIGAFENPPVFISSNSNDWTFGIDGSLTVPGVVQNANSFQIQAGTAPNTVEFLGQIDNGFGDGPGATLHVTSIIYGTITDGMTIYGEGLPVEGWVLQFGTVMEPQGNGGIGNYYLPGANYLIGSQLFNNGDAPNSTWTFGTDGDLTLPNNSEIRVDGDNVEVGGMTNFNVEAVGVVNIYTDTDGATPFQWQFGDDGNLSIPGSVTLSNSSTLAAGTFDNGTGGNNGISLNCVVGYELNWQGGHLKNTYDGGLTAANILADSAIEFPGSGTDNMEINSSGLIFPDGTTQNTASVGGVTIEEIHDNLGESFLVAGTGISLSYDDNLDTLTILTSGVAFSDHTHTASDITDFSSSVSGLLPVKDIFGGNGVSVSSVSGEYTISASGVAAGSAESILTNCFNNTGSTLSKGTVVYINGRSGNLPTVQKSIATNEAGSSKTYGILFEDITDNHSGRIIVVGALTDFNTNQFSAAEGSTLYLSPSVSGAMTATKPSAPNHLVSVGKIVRNHNNQGIIQVVIQNGFELQELHNVAISGVTNGQFLQYNSGSELWVPSSSGTFTILNVDNLQLDGNTLSSTSGDIIINPSGSGSLQRDSGGDARGSYAIDWQSQRFSNNQVASGMNSVIGGGSFNRAAGQGNVIGGGNGNFTNGLESVIAGGTTNQVTGNYSAICGGDRNVASGNYSFIAGGSLNSDGGYNNVFILGSNITAVLPNTTYVENLRTHTNGWVITNNIVAPSGNLTLEPFTTGSIYLNSHIVRVGDINAAATITTNGSGNLTISTNGGTNSGSIVINQGVDGNISITPNGTGEVDLSKVDIDGGSIDGTAIGANSASTGKFTQLYPTVVSNGTVSGNVTTNVAAGQIFDMTVNGATTLSNPTNAVNGVTVRWRITQDGTGGHSVSLDTKFQIPSSASSPLPWSTAAGATDILAATYHAGRDKWDVVAFVPGY